MNTKAISLKQLAEGKADGIQKATFFKLDPDVVEFEAGFNLREETAELTAHLEAMYVAMKAGAYFPPIDVSVVNGRVVCRDGHCRTRTAKRIKAEGIEIALEARQFRGNDADCVFHMLGSASGKALTPLEVGRGYLRLIRFGHEVQAIADKTGVSRTTVENGLILAEAPAELQQMINRGEVAAHTAIAVIRQHGDKALEVLRATLDKAKESGEKRITSKHVSRRIPPRIVRSVLSEIKTSMTGTAIRELLQSPEDELVGKEVTIDLPAKVIRDLLAAQADADNDEE